MCNEKNSDLDLLDLAALQVVHVNVDAIWMDVSSPTGR